MMRLACRTLVPFILLISGAAQGHAQSPFDGYWKALSEAPTLQASGGVAAPIANTAAEKLIVSGLSRLRKYEFTTDRTDALVAIHDLTRAVEREPKSAWAHYALGMALARGSDMRMRPYAQRSSYKPGIYSLAAAHGPDELQRALELDPELDGAALELAYASLDLMIVPLMKKSLDLLGTPRRQADPRAVFMAAQIHNRLGNYQQALDLVSSAESMGFDRSVAAIERVIALAQSRAPEKLIAAHYFDGASRLTNAGAERYFAGVVQIAGKAEIEAWRKASLRERREWVEQFWKTTAAKTGVPRERMIATLYGKYVAAYRIRGMTVIGGRPEEPHKVSLLGKIFPRVRVGGALVHNGVEAGVIDRAALEYKPKYEHNVIMAWEALQFRRDTTGTTQVVGAMLVLPGSVDALSDSPGIVDAIATISIVDTVANISAQESTRIQYMLPDLSGTHSLLLGVTADAPPVRRALVRVSVENAAGTGGAIGKGMIDIMQFDRDSLTMSDVVLSPEDGVPSFERGSIKVALAPGRLYTPSETPTLYYEVYGLQADQKVTSTITITRATRRNDFSEWEADRNAQPISFSFSDAAVVTPDYGMQQSRKLGLSAVNPGVYLIRVTIEDDRGRKQSRTRFIQIVQGK